MQCQTVLPGTECTFWSKSGCTFEDHSCRLVIEQCQGCDRIVEGTIGSVCSVAPAPQQKWIAGLCNFATHQKFEIKIEDVRVNPLKASKKASAKKK
ncbi:PxxKW family cysteine-rich protein [Desulfuromonas sp. TF]|uniref:PxxKW family cysteine-rich protein n=1 Tax=Desulfuromonas sp. TF TaxID=1232410 RepID=UPI00047FF6E7|nr:PxxKW family cysteine-rich protein [Desulfuromonas sp. TF]